MILANKIKRGIVADVAPPTPGVFAEDFESGLGNYTPAGTDDIFIVTDLNGNALTCNNNTSGADLITRDFGAGEDVNRIEFDVKVTARGSDDVGLIVVRDTANNRIFSVLLARATINDSQRRSFAFTDSANGAIGPVLVIGTTYHYIVDLGTPVTVTIKDGVTIHAGPTLFTAPARTDPQFLLFGAGGDGDSIGVGRFDDIISFKV